MISFVGEAKPIGRAEIVAAANAAGIPERVLRAVMRVESLGKGFDSKKRPVILFEPHVFYRQLKPLGLDKIKEGLDARVAYAEWGMRPYPPGQDAQYERLKVAVDIAPEQACRSISIGLGQVLGENFHAAGAESAIQMFNAAKVSEAAQLGQMLAYIHAKGLDVALRQKDWRNFARSYNGKGQVDVYAGKLAKQYALLGGE